ncbi:MAG: DNA repair protein RadA [Candidatus Daviesbacteria bacterium]|nr:MAG: DNA repair protein RadA [Candidatus Daviesbacteria bacterium]
MPRLTSVYICQQCGYQSSQYLGRCPNCDSWNSFVEEVEEVVSSRQQAVNKAAEIVNLAEFDDKGYERISTKMEEFDRVLGGGVVKGSLVLVAGEPGVGKSTLLTHLSINIPNTLYVAGEESPSQIKLRVNRINPKAQLFILNETDVDVIIGAIKQFQPGLVIIDSIQVLQTTDLSSVAGSVGQVRECAYRLQRLAKESHIPIFLVGHVTKEGTVAGPKTLEHLVDVVLSLEGDQTSQFRILRGNKNRFGPTDEVGIFEMAERGMDEVKNPSRLFLESKQNSPGSAVTAIITGLRPLLVEIQALVVKTSLSFGRRVALGIDNNRLQLLVAVLQKRLNLPLFQYDIFVNVTGGLRINEPAADLAIILALASSFKDKIIPAKTVFIGEVGLLGEIRSVKALEKRITEAKKLGYTRVISSKNTQNISEIIKKIS